MDETKNNNGTDTLNSATYQYPNMSTEQYEEQVAMLKGLENMFARLERRINGATKALDGFSEGVARSNPRIAQNAIVGAFCANGEDGVACIQHIKFKILRPNAKAPQRAYTTDAGFDLFASTRTIQGKEVRIGLGVAVAIPKGYVGLLFSRSSIRDKPLMQSNGVGVIDSGYRGEICIVFHYANVSKSKSLDDDERFYKVGERCAQLVIVPIPSVKLTEVNELSPSERGTGGFGSTGNK